MKRSNLQVRYNLYLEIYIFFCRPKMERTILVVFIPFQRSWNGNILAGSTSFRSFVRSFVHSFIRSFVHVSQNLGLCTANKRIHVEKTQPHVNFHLNRQRPWPSFPRSRIRIENSGSSYVIISQTVTHTLLLWTHMKSFVGYIWTHIVRVDVVCTFRMWTNATVIDRSNTATN